MRHNSPYIVLVLSRAGDTKGKNVLHVEQAITSTTHVVCGCKNHDWTQLRKQSAIAICSPASPLVPHTTYNTVFFPTLVSQILGMGCACPSRPLACSGMSFLPSSEVNSTIYSTVTSMHALASGIVNAACNLVQSINGYKFADKTLGLASGGGSPVEKICSRSVGGQDCFDCDAHLFQHQCKL